MHQDKSSEANRDRVLHYIAQWPGQNDDEIAKALGISPRQTVNAICRDLAKEGLIARRKTGTGKIRNFAAAASPDKQTSASSQNATAVQRAEDEWFWEGKVATAFAAHFAKDGWRLIAQADTAQKAKGVDLHMRRDGVDMMMEVKGCPTSYYRDPRRRGEKKPTNPSVQAKHWFSSGFFQTVQMANRAPGVAAAFGLPYFSRYVDLANSILPSLTALGLPVFLLRESHDVERIGPLPPSLASSALGR